MGFISMTSVIFSIQMTPVSTSPANVYLKSETGYPSICYLQLDISWTPAIQLNLFSSATSYPLAHLTPNSITKCFSSVIEVSMNHSLIYSVTQPHQGFILLFCSPSYVLVQMIIKCIHFYLLSIPVMHPLVSISVISILVHSLIILGPDWAVSPMASLFLVLTLFNLSLLCCQN